MSSGEKEAIIKGSSDPISTENQDTSSTTTSLFGNLSKPSTTASEASWDPFLAARMILEPMNDSKEIQRVLIRKLKEIGVDPDMSGARGRVEELLKRSSLNSTPSGRVDFPYKNTSGGESSRDDGEEEDYMLKNQISHEGSAKNREEISMNGRMKSGSGNGNGRGDGNGKSKNYTEIFKEYHQGESHEEKGPFLEDEDEEDDGASLDFAWTDGASGNKKKRKNIRSSHNPSGGGSGDGGNAAYASRIDESSNERGFFGNNNNEGDVENDDKEYQREPLKENEREIEYEEDLPPPLYYLVKPRIPLSKRPLALIRQEVSKRFRAVRSARVRIKEAEDLKRKEIQERESEEIKRKELELAEKEKEKDKKPLKRSSKAEKRAQAMRGGGGAAPKMSIAAIRAARAGTSGKSSGNSTSKSKEEDSKGDVENEPTERLDSDYFTAVDSSTGGRRSSSKTSTQDENSSNSLRPSSPPLPSSPAASIIDEDLIPPPPKPLLPPPPVGNGKFDFKFDSPISERLNLVRKAIELFQSKLNSEEVPISNAVLEATKSLSKLTEKEGGILGSAVAMFAVAKAAAEALTSGTDGNGNDKEKELELESLGNKIQLPRMIEKEQSTVNEVRVGIPEDVEKFFLNKELAKGFKNGKFTTILTDPPPPPPTFSLESEDSKLNRKVKVDTSSSSVQQTSNPTTQTQPAQTPKKSTINSNAPVSASSSPLKQKSALFPPTPSSPNVPKTLPPPPKMTRRRKANMNNVHHRTNYVPSRLPSNGTSINPNSSNPNSDSSSRVDPDTKPGLDHPTSSNSLFLDEWCCLFCDYELFYGEPPRMLKACGKRKKLLKKKKKAKEGVKEGFAGTGNKGKGMGIASGVSNETSTQDATAQIESKSKGKKKAHSDHTETCTCGH